MDTGSWNNGQDTGRFADTDRQTVQGVYPQEPVQENNDSPFEEPEQAPELLGARSESLYSRNEPFWDRVYELPKEGESYPRDPNYWNHPEELSDDRIMMVDTGEKKSLLRGLLGSDVVKKTLAIAAVLLVVAGVLFGAVFRVRSITVSGSASISDAEIIRLSGISLGMNTISIDEALVEERLHNAQPYLRDVLVDVKWNSVAIHVREREPAAALKNRGVLVVTDNKGWVLEESQNTDDPAYSDLVFVSGLDVRHYVMGEQLILRNNAQLPVFSEILIELKAMGGLSLIKELDLSNMDSIYLDNGEGLLIRLGSSAQIHQKLRAMLITREKVLSMGYEKGTIDVSDPIKPTFTPDSQ